MEASANHLPHRTTPGRWVGGLAGVAACVAIAIATGVVVMLTDPNGWARGNGFLGQEGLVMIAVGGLPIAFLGGRALLPAARSGGWLTALAVGFTFGLIAPPLGAIEVVLVAMLPFSGSTSGFDDNVTGFLFLLPIALVYSYVVAVLTVPAGLLWALIVRAIPEHALQSVELGRTR
jgi:ascorbate-specific PTS system EIIC-type component UlaA